MVAALTAGTAIVRQDPVKRPNVVMILSDQHQASCLGVEGHPEVKTPHLDRLAASGMRFRNAYTQNPICTPSRVSILSAQYPHNHGYFGNGGIAPRLPSLLSHFRSHGYRTAAIGKIHVPADDSNWIEPHCDLFAECYRYGQGGDGLSDAYGGYLSQLGLREKEDSIRLPEFPGRQQHEGRPSLLSFAHSVEGWTVQRALDFIKQPSSRPFCMQVSFPRPHPCYTPSQQFWDMYPSDLALPRGIDASPAGRPPNFQQMVANYRKLEWLIEPKSFEEGARRVWRAYLACISQTDYAVGRLLDHLQEQGLAENTIVVYASDHGAYTGTFGVQEKAPGICSEAVCRVPMLWRVPGVTAPDSTSEEFAELVDITPTLTSLAGLPPLDTVDGRDLTPVLQGKAAVRNLAVTENVWSKALRWENWRYVHYPQSLFGKDWGELYDLASDPDETKNLYFDSGSQRIVAESRRLLFDWFIETTRYVSLVPLPPGVRTYQEAAGPDGRESNRYGVRSRILRRQWNYL
jgi:arylsulfatase A-like enzyme